MPTILTIKHHDIAVTIVKDNNEMCVDEMFDMFKTAFIGVSYTQSQFEQYILEYAEELKETL